MAWLGGGIVESYPADTVRSEGFGRYHRATITVGTLEGKGPETALPTPARADVAGPAGLATVLRLVGQVEDYSLAGMSEEPTGGWSLNLGKAKLTWSADALTVTKTAVPHLSIAHWAHLLGTPRQAALNELRVNQLLRDVPPPVAVPALVRSNRRQPSMTFEAVDGVPLGPKFPSWLSGAEVEGLVAARTPSSPGMRKRWPSC